MVNLKSKRPLIISGPCSVETQEQTLSTIKELAASDVVDIIRGGIWKPRTRPGNFEGIGEVGLEWMAQAKKETGIPFAVEVATSKHVELALKHGTDVLWIGARTTVNPFSVQDIADALKGVKIPVMVKNPMNPDIELWQGAVQRLQAVGIEDIALIHRGFSIFGSSKYRNNPMWHIAIEMRRRMPDLPMICDPSHICGNREYLKEVSQQSADMNFDGLIIESHINPDAAWSDASQQLTPAALIEMVRSIKWRKDNENSEAYVRALTELRGQIDHLDSELLTILSKRMSIAEKIGQIKKDNNVAILQTGRWSNIIDRVVSQSGTLNLSNDFLTKVLEAIHVESINKQNSIMNKE